jgi:ABC-2 type transport system ATP-binding protein
MKPSAGHARVAGYDVMADQGAVRQSIGLVFQDPSLDDQLTAYENLRPRSRLQRSLKSAIAADRGYARLDLWSVATGR